MPHQFDNQDTPQNTAFLRAQRMTADEAKAVIDLWQRERDEQTGLTDRPAVPDIAEGLNLAVEDVQRLLGEVRERRAEEERALAYEQELAEIRLAEMERKRAEEERKLAEVRRQRAELRREQGKAELRQNQEGEERRREILARLQVQSNYEMARPSLYTKTVISRTSYIVGCIIVSLALAVFLTLRSLEYEREYKRSLTRIYSERLSYDAKGKPSVSDVTCGDGPDHDVPCDATIVASEKEKYQQSYKTQVGDDDEPVTAKKQHDRKTHRRNH